MWLVLICAVVFLQQNCLAEEYFSSVDKLRELRRTEVELRSELERFIGRKGEGYADYQYFLQRLRQEHESADLNEEEYIGNPINSFRLIKRLTTDWQVIQNQVERRNETQEDVDFLKNLSKGIAKVSKAELSQALEALNRLINIYKLEDSDFAEGILNGTDYGFKLDWEDSFFIAQYYFDRGSAQATRWFDIALRKIETEERMAWRNRTFLIDFLNYTASAEYELGNVDMLRKILEALLHFESMPVFEDGNISSVKKSSDRIIEKLSFLWYANYTRLCRGEQAPERVHHRLKCKLVTKGSPFFILAPLKVEELSLNPEIVLYHGLLKDTQISQILNEVAQHKSARSRVLEKNGEKVVNTRVSQQVWLSYESPVMRSIYNLVSKVTGFDLSNSETMQAANYGIGGQFEPHYDFLEDDEDDRWLGDRLSTQMFYLSDVEQGGYTVFPYLNVYVKPVKGSMVVWHNLHKSLVPDYRMLHAGCPVLKGSKRIGNIWIHSGFQEFRHPCSLQNDAVQLFGSTYSNVLYGLAVLIIIAIVVLKIVVFKLNSCHKAFCVIISLSRRCRFKVMSVLGW